MQLIYCAKNFICDNVSKTQKSVLYAWKRFNKPDYREHLIH